MIDAKQEALARLDSLRNKDKASFFDLFRQLYNSLCRSCQLKAGRMGAKIKYELLCDECRIKAKQTEKKVNEVLSR